MGKFVGVSLEMDLQVALGSEPKKEKKCQTRLKSVLVVDRETS